MSAKAFLLDPVRNESATERHLPGFLRLASEKAGWTISRASQFKPGMDGARWLADLRQQIEDADVLVGLGNYLALYQTGDELPTFLELLSAKLDAGSHVILDHCRALVTNSFPDLGSQIADMLKRRGVRLTTTQVASRIPEYTAHSSDTCCAFHKVDDCLLDPWLFEGVDTVWASGSTLISYAPTMFPIIEASGLHFFVDEHDLLARGALGQKNAVAVRNQNLTIFSGGVLSDRVGTMGGVLPGVEDNALFAERLIDSLKRSFRPSTETTAFELYSQLERTLGQLIEDVLNRSGAESEFVKLLSERTLKRIGTDSGGLDLSKAMFLDLVLVLRDLWSRFQPLFSQVSGQPVEHSEISTQLFELNELRNALMHPIKRRDDKLAVSTADVERLRRALATIIPAARAARAKYRSP